MHTSSPCLRHLPRPVVGINAKGRARSRHLRLSPSRPTYWMWQPEFSGISRILLSDDILDPLPCPKIRSAGTLSADTPAALSSACAKRVCLVVMMYTGREEKLIASTVPGKLSANSKCTSKRVEAVHGTGKHGGSEARGRQGKQRCSEA